MKITSDRLPISVNGLTLEETDIPDSVTLPEHPNDIDWSGDWPDGYETAIDKALDEATEADKNNWLSDRIRKALKQYEPPSGNEAYAEIEKYLREKYTLNQWANMMDANPILIELIKNEEYQNAVDRADYLANDSDSLVDSEDADKLREVTKV